jgi:hypothetical protein
MTAWEQAIKMAEAACPYRPLPANDESLSDAEYDQREDEDLQRRGWVRGYVCACLGVPPSMIDSHGRFFWQGYEAGEAARLAENQPA